MSNKYNTEIVANTTGYSDTIPLEEGVWNIFVSSPSWGNADLVVKEGGKFYDAKSAYTGTYGKINFTEDSVIEINGGIVCGLNVNSIASGITLVAKKSL